MPTNCRRGNRPLLHRANQCFMLGSFGWHALVCVSMRLLRETWPRRSTSEAMPPNPTVRQCEELIGPALLQPSQSVKRAISSHFDNEICVRNEVVGINSNLPGCPKLFRHCRLRFADCYSSRAGRVLWYADRLTGPKPSPTTAALGSMIGPPPPLLRTWKRTSGRTPHGS